MVNDRVICRSCSKAILLALTCLLLALPVYSQAPARRLPEAETLAKQIWDKLLTKCGNSYYLYLPPRDGLSDRFEQWQYKDFRFDIVPQPPAKRSSGAQWEGVVVMNAAAFRSRTAKPNAARNGANPEAWDAWKKWGDGFVPSNAFLLGMRPGIGDPPNVIWMKKEGGKWWFGWGGRGYVDSLSDFDEIIRRKPSCRELSDDRSTN